MEIRGETLIEQIFSGNFVKNSFCYHLIFSYKKMEQWEDTHEKKVFFGGGRTTKDLSYPPLPQ